MRPALKKHQASEGATVSKFTVSLLQCSHKLFASFYDEWGEHTNNIAGQGMRPPVM